MRYVRLVHPHHPQTGQVVKVIRQAGHPTEGQRGWVIELPDGTHSRMPLAGAVEFDDTTNTPPSVVTLPDGLWAGRPCRVRGPTPPEARRD